MENSVFPLLSVNKPITDMEQDKFYIYVQMQELKKALDEKANFIGIISEHGGGKTSIVHSFAKENEYELCNICLWDYEGKEIGKKNDINSSFVQSFLYQLARIVKPRSFARNVNRMMSKNYRAISWSSDLSVWKWFLLVLIFGCYGLIVIAAGYYEGKEMVDNETLKKLCQIALYGKEIFRICAMVLGLWIVSDNNIVFSWKDDKIDRVMGEADTCEIFERIIAKAGKRKRTFSVSEDGERKKNPVKYIINIEDLDRVTDQKAVREFLKVLYKYNNLLTENEKMKFIFIVSLSSGLSLKTENKDFYKLYEKIFDYVLILRPMNKERKEDFLNNLLNEQEKRMKKSLESEINATRDEICKWLIKGENIGIREIKLRLNKAMAIYEELDQLGEDGPDTISFSKCAIVAYLESVYPVETYRFVFSTDPWHKIMQELIHLEDEGNVDRKQMLGSKIGKLRKMNNQFKQELIEVFSEQMSGKDYWIYFHRNPRKYKVQ